MKNANKKTEYNIEDSKNDIGGESHDAFQLDLELLTEEELITYLRIPEVSKATNHHNVIENLKRMHDLPCIHICRQPLYPKKAIRKWIEEKTNLEK